MTTISVRSGMVKVKRSYGNKSRTTKLKLKNNKGIVKPSKGKAKPFIKKANAKEKMFARRVDAGMMSIGRRMFK